MKDDNPPILVKLLLYWYIFIFVSTEVLSYLHLLERNYILLAQIFFWTGLLFFYRQKILQLVRSINFRSKSILLILTLFLLTFIQGFFSAPSTTDSMVYHIPRVMYWMQEKTLFQDVIRNTHDYMAPFGEYILLHLYLIFDSDRMLFFSQWIAYVFSVYIIGVIASQFGADQKLRQLVRLFTATLPIIVMQSTNTQVDTVVTVLLLLSLHVTLLLKKTYSFKYSILLGCTIGLGFLTKATFAFYILIPIGMLAFFLYKNFKRAILIIIPILFLALVLQLRFISQNILLYGSPLGVELSDKGEEAVYINEVIGPFSTLSNLIRNSLVNLPIPIFSSYIQNLIINLHNLIGFDVSDPRITCCSTKFSVQSILYPQEDIVANPVHFIVIIVGGYFLISRRKQLNKNAPVVTLYLLTLITFVVFSTLIKWQPFHPRLEIPYFIVGSMSAIMILSSVKNLKLLYIGAVLSSILALVVIFLNVSRPYISYSLFYNVVQSFKPTLASIPEAFYIKPHEQQYFNARYYWYEPYSSIVSLIAQRDYKGTIAFNLPDGFEYPLWALMKKQNMDLRVIPYSQITKETILFSTTVRPFDQKGYKTVCIKTKVEYGYACLSEPD